MSIHPINNWDAEHNHKKKYTFEDCYETWTSDKKEKSCPYCGSDMITIEKKREK